MAADDFAAASARLAEAVRLSTTDPADAIRLLLPLAEWQPPVIPGNGALARAARATQAALASNLRCSACAELAIAAQAYQPISYQDAQALRLAVCDAIDVEAIDAADSHRDATFLALRDLRTAVAIDLSVRGAYLASLVEITRSASMPSLVEAWTLYQDTSREPELVASAGPPHPLFMPYEYSALSR